MKDFIAFTGIVMLVIVCSILVWSFSIWKSPVDIFLLHQSTIWLIIRIGFCVALGLASYFHKASYKDDLEKLERLR